MLGEDELAAPRPSRPGLAEFAQHRVELAVGAAVERETLHRVLQRIGNERENRPPVTWCARRRARIGDRVTVAENLVVHAMDKSVVGLGTGHLA